MTRAKSKPKSSPRLGRRSFLKLSGAAIAATQFPHVWIPNQAAAQACIGAAGTYKHLLFIRLNGGFRFPVAFNANVSGAYNPFGSASGVSLRSSGRAPAAANLRQRRRRWLP